MAISLYYPSSSREISISNLKSAQNENGGWCFTPARTENSYLSVWTTAQALAALQINNERPKYFREAISLIEKSQRVQQKKTKTGWFHRNLEGEFGTCITSDCIIALLLAGKINSTKIPLKEIYRQQHTKTDQAGGWGFTENDNISKVTATCWALRALMYANQYHELQVHKLLLIFRSGLEWLIRAKSDKGWGESLGGVSRVSCTAWAIVVLLESLKFEKIISLGPMIKQSVNEAMTWLRGEIDVVHEGWVGTDEAYGQRTFFGLGSPIVLIALLKCAEHNILHPYDESISLALQELLKYGRKEGTWVHPWYREPRILDSSYWLLALLYFQEFYLRNSRSISEHIKKLEETIEKKEEIIKKSKESLKKRLKKRKRLIKNFGIVFSYILVVCLILYSVFHGKNGDFGPVEGLMLAIVYTLIERIFGKKIVAFIGRTLGLSDKNIE